MLVHLHTQCSSTFHLCLSMSSLHRAGKGFEEVFVPAATPAPPPKDGELVSIDFLPPWAQMAFAGYKTLNRIQSRIFDAAFHTNQNLLVCAPTGAGKTNIAMISVLHEVGANMSDDGVIDGDAFKVVYVAPMKALAAEVTAAFAKRLEPLGTCSVYVRGGNVSTGRLCCADAGT